MTFQSLTQLGEAFGYRNASMPADLQRVLKQLQTNVTAVALGASGVAISLASAESGGEVKQAIYVASVTLGNMGLIAGTEFTIQTLGITPANATASGKTAIVEWVNPVA
jgi:CBS domain containing-hemolysin-like protein